MVKFYFRARGLAVVGSVPEAITVMVSFFSTQFHDPMNNVVPGLEFFVRHHVFGGFAGAVAGGKEQARFGGAQRDCICH